MPSRTLCFAIAACLTASTGGVLANSPIIFDQDNSGTTTFQTPSGNIGCVFVPVGGTETYVPEDGGPELSCDRVAPSYLRFTLTASGPGAIVTNVGDQGCCGGPNILPYGEFWSIPPFTC